MAEIGKVTMLVVIDPDALNAIRDLSSALDKIDPTADQRLIGILRDVWVQFSIDRRKGGDVVGRWAGGLSVLEDVEYELRAAGMINENGFEVD